MTCSRLFVCWAIAVCLAACLSVSAAADKTADEKQKEIEKSVGVLQTLTEETLINTTRLRNHARHLRARAETNKQNAHDAISHVNNVPQDNEKAVEIANKIKKTSTQIFSMYAKANEAAKASFQGMGKLVTEAKELDEEAYNKTEPFLNLPTKHAEIKQNITNVTTKVEIFQTKLQEEKTKLQSASRLEIDMSSLVQTIKVEKYHFSVILSVAQIDNALEKAKSDVGKTKNNMDEINNTLKEMIKISTTATKSSAFNVAVVIEKAKSALLTATKAVDNVTKLKEEILQIKMNANTSLAKFTDKTTPIQVVGEVSKTKKYVDEVKTKTRKIATALQSAESAAESAKSAKQSILNLLSPGNTQQSGEMTKDSEVQLKSSTDTFQHSLNVNPRMNTLKRTVTGTSENSLQQESDTLTVGKGQQTNVNNLNIQKDQLTKGTNNGKNIPSVNGKHSAGGASGDGSMILSVPLLAALIASAVLH